MIVQCEGCSTRFRIADEKVAPKGVRVRCTKCKATFIVRPQPRGGGAPEKRTAAGHPSQPPRKASKGTAPSKVGNPAAAAAVAEAAPPPPLDDDVVGEAADPLSLVRSSSEEAASFDLDALLGKDFDLGLPPPPEGSGEQGQQEAAAFETSSEGAPGPAEAPASPQSPTSESPSSDDPFGSLESPAKDDPFSSLESAAAGESSGALDGPPADGPFGAVESPAGADSSISVESPPSDDPFGSLESAPSADPTGAPDGPAAGELEQTPREDPGPDEGALRPPPTEGMGQPSSEAAPDPSGLGAHPGGQALPVAGASRTPDPSQESAEKPDLPSSLFEGLDLAEGGEAGSKEKPLTSLFEGDFEREDSPVPTEEDVDAALAAFDSAFEPDKGALSAEDVTRQGAPDVVQQEPAPPAPEPPAERIEVGSSAQTDDPFASFQEDPAPIPEGLGVEKRARASEEEPVEPQAAEGWSEGSGSVELDLGQGEEAAPGEPGQGEDPFAAASVDLDLSIDPSGVPGSGPPAAPAGGQDAAAAGIGPGPDLGETGKARAFEGGMPDLNLDLGSDDLPPLSLDDAPSVAFNPGAGEPAAETAEGGALSFDDGGEDPFAGLDGPGGGSSEDLFGSPTDLSGEGEGEPPGPEPGAVAPLGRIDVASAKEAEQPSPAKPSKEQVTKDKPRRRPLHLLALLANGVFAVALLGVGLMAFVLFRTGGPLDASLLSPDRVKEAFTPSAVSGPVVLVQSGGSYQTRTGEEIIFVRGRVENLSDARIPVRTLAVEGRLLGTEDVVLQESPAILGEMPSSEDLWRISGEPSIQRLRRRLAARGGVVEPGESVDFFLIFQGLPPEPEAPRFEAFLVDG